MVNTWREQRRSAHAGDGRPCASGGKAKAPVRTAQAPAPPEPPTDRWKPEQDGVVGSEDVEALIQLALSLAPDFAQHVDKYRRELVSRFGGRLHISHRRDLSARNEAIRRDYLKGEHFGLLERRYGLCKRQLINIIKG